MIRTFDYEKLPIVEIVNEIILDAIKRGASDIHFDPLADHMRVRIRVDGELTDYTTVPNTLKRNLITRIKIISGMNITEIRLPQDGSIQTILKDVNLDLRVSSLPTNEGEKIVIRILDYSMSLKGLEYLGFSEENYKKMLEMISVPNGIILVTGATGTGKSTTVYSILQKLNRENTNVITVEDPVEMDLEGVNQVQVNSDIGLTFANILRSVLRQDPNIIMIGEIRDNETARIAVRASITGHLVLSTIHTNNSLNTIERLLDMEVERYLLASALEGIVSQKLARRLCEKCRKVRPTNQYEKNLFKTVLDKDVSEVYSAEGCDECNNGYRGRRAIHEVLIINQAIRDALADGVSKEKLRELVYKSDVTTLLQDGLEKVLDGSTTCEEVLKLIELDDDLEGKTKEYRYSLNKAIEETTISKKGENVTSVGQVASPAQEAAASISGEQVVMQPKVNANTTPVDVPVQTPIPPIGATPVDVPVQIPIPPIGATPVNAPIQAPTQPIGATPVNAPIQTPIPHADTTPMDAPIQTPTPLTTPTINPTQPIPSKSVPTQTTTTGQ